jgi:hypothetical protein
VHYGSFLQMSEDTVVGEITSLSGLEETTKPIMVLPEPGAWL